jgi:hypothetical protein
LGFRTVSKLTVRAKTTVSVFVAASCRARVGCIAIWFVVAGSNTDISTAVVVANTTVSELVAASSSAGVGATAVLGFRQDKKQCPQPKEVEKSSMGTGTKDSHDGSPLFRDPGNADSGQRWEMVGLMRQSMLSSELPQCRVFKVNRVSRHLQGKASCNILLLFAVSYLSFDEYDEGGCQLMLSFPL